MTTVLNKLDIAAWAGFVVTQGKVFRAIEDDLRQKAGITHAEYEVLLRLSSSKENRERIQTLAAQSMLSRSGTSRAVDRLVRAGYVVRVGAEEDGRGAYAVLTDAGKAHYEQARADHLKLVKALFIDRFSVDERRLLAGFWERFRDIDLESGRR